MNYLRLGVYTAKQLINLALLVLCAMTAQSNELSKRAEQITTTPLNVAEQTDGIETHRDSSAAITPEPVNRSSSPADLRQIQPEEKPLPNHRKPDHRRPDTQPGTSPHRPDPRHGFNHLPTPASNAFRPATDNANRALLAATQSTETNDLIIYDEWLVRSDSMAVAEQERRQLAANGIKIKQRQHLKSLGYVLSVYSLPEKADPYSLFRQINMQLPAINIEFNQRYLQLSSSDLSSKSKTSFDPKRYGHALTRMPTEGCKPLRGVIAMMDSKVNTDLMEFKQFNMTSIDSVRQEQKVSSDHGTAVAYLFTQLAPEATLLAINIYAQVNTQTETRTDWLLAGFETVLSYQPKPLVLNMSFGGLPGALLEDAIQTLAEHEIRLVAAAGNNGPDAAPVYPAAYPNVVAVSAVDITETKWTHANQGNYIEISAPGVDLWLIGKTGKARYFSGTSFAAPWVSVLAALTTLEQWLNRGQFTKDIGPTGFDAEYGKGLVQFHPLCHGG